MFYNLRSFWPTCTFAWVISYALGVYQHDQGIPAQIPQAKGIVPGSGTDS